jgi:hypothetical protein
MLRKTIQTALILLLMTEAVYAQTPMPGVHLNEDQGKRPRTKEQHDKAVDRAYQSATKKIPEQNKLDPWDRIRPAPSAASKNKQP